MRINGIVQRGLSKGGITIKAEVTNPENIEKVSFRLLKGDNEYDNEQRDGDKNDEWENGQRPLVDEVEFISTPFEWKIENNYSNWYTIQTILETRDGEIFYDDIPIQEEMKLLQEHFNLTTAEVLSTSSTGGLIAALSPSNKDEITTLLTKKGFTHQVQEDSQRRWDDTLLLTSGNNNFLSQQQIPTLRSFMPTKNLMIYINGTHWIHNN